tara:strand:- start:2620 stop:3033 length:414 start_codon:yes stop_codon:yes gene_type:complete
VGCAVAAALAGYLLWGQIEANAALRARTDSIMQDNQHWAERFAALRQQQDHIDRLDAELAEVRAQQRTAYRGLASKLQELRHEMPDVRDWADARAPAPLVSSLCERGAFTREAAARLCPSADALPGALPGATTARRD